jgi:hypothetical protein
MLACRRNEDKSGSALIWATSSRRATWGARPVTPTPAKKIFPDAYGLGSVNIVTTNQIATATMSPPTAPMFSEFAELLKAYGVTSVRGDRYAGEWPRERFRVHGIDYVPAAKPKSDIYRDLLPILNSGRAELLDHARLVAQLLGLERSTARGGRDSIDHAPGAHDDLANAAAGALTMATKAGSEFVRFSIITDAGAVGPAAEMIGQTGQPTWPRVVANNELPPPRLWPPSDLDRRATDWHLR